MKIFEDKKFYIAFKILFKKNKKTLAKIKICGIIIKVNEYRHRKSGLKTHSFAL